MAKTKISWATDVWNPVTGCTRVSPGCDHCYAYAMTKRLAAMGMESYQGLCGNGHFNGVVKCHPDRLDQPLRWRKPRRIFVNSMSDLFHDCVDEEYITAVFNTMLIAKRHTFIVLTKRPERMKDFIHKWVDCTNTAEVYTGLDASTRPCGYGLPGVTRTPPSNVWLGVSIEDQATADKRIPLLLDTPAAVRLLSIEPCLGPIDLNDTPSLSGHRPVNGATENDIRGCLPKWQTHPTRAKLRDGIDWVIVGGESGPKARPMNPDWARSIRDQCRQANTPFFMKQMSGKTKAQRSAIPDDLMIREFPVT